MGQAPRYTSVFSPTRPCIPQTPPLRGAPCPASTADLLQPPSLALVTPTHGWLEACAGAGGPGSSLRELTTGSGGVGGATNDGQAAVAGGGLHKRRLGRCHAWGTADDVGSDGWRGDHLTILWSSVGVRQFSVMTYLANQHPYVLMGLQNRLDGLEIALRLLDRSCGI